MHRRECSVVIVRLMCHDSLQMPKARPLSLWMNVLGLVLSHRFTVITGGNLVSDEGRGEKKNCIHNF